MNLYNLATELQNVSPELTEATTMSNIAYLPSGFSNISTMLKVLAKKKRNWDIEILEQDGTKHITFGDELKISVPLEHWNDFTTRFNFDLGEDAKQLSLEPLLKEAMEDEIDKLSRELKPALVKLFDGPEFISVDRTVRVWEARFGVNRYLDLGDILILQNHKKIGIEKLFGNLLSIYDDDKGGLEMLIDACREKRPLNAFAVFKKYDWLYGIGISSTYHGVGLIFEVLVNPAYQVTQTIAVLKNPEVTDEIEGYTSVKVVRNVIFPRGKDGTFDTGFFKTLQDVIDDVVE